MNNHIYTRNTNQCFLDDQGWQLLSHSCCVTGIDISGGYIYGVGTDRKVWKRHVGNSGRWSKIINTGAVLDVAVDGNRLFGVGTDHKIYEHPVNGGSWKRVIHHGAVTAIAHSNNFIYGVGTNKYVYRHTSNEFGGDWAQVLGCCLLSLTEKGTKMLGVGTDHKVWVHDFNFGRRLRLLEDGQSEMADECGESVIMTDSVSYPDDIGMNDPSETEEEVRASEALMNQQTTE